jgi:hypothetical protein
MAGWLPTPSLPHFGFHGHKPEQAILIAHVPPTAKLGYNNNSITSKVSARYNTELF